MEKEREQIYYRARPCLQEATKRVTCQGLFRWLFGCRRKKYARIKRIVDFCQMMTALGKLSQLCSYLFKELELREFGGQSLIFVSLLNFLGLPSGK